MKNPLLKTTVLLALLLGSQNSNASLVTANSDYWSGVQNGDLILGVRKATDTGTGTSFMVDLGQFSDLASYLSGGNSLNLTTDFATAAVFNSGSTAGLVYGVFGVGADNSVYATKSVNSGYGNLASSSVSSLSYGALVGNNTIFGALQDQSQTTANGVYVSSANAQSWYALSVAGFGASQFGNGALEAAAGSVAYLAKGTPNLAGTGSGSVVGQFLLNNSGVLTYTAAAVPEPSTYALLGVGLALMLVGYRRKLAASSSK